MILPKREVVHQNLSTEYTDVADLLSTFTTNGFAGIVEITLAQHIGAFLVSDHKVLTAAVESGPTSVMTVGDEALQELLALSALEAGTINVYRLAPNQVESIATRLASEMVFKGLSTDFVKLDRFIQKLRIEKHNGFIDIFTKENKPMGTLFLKEGELADLQMSIEPGVALLPEGKSIPDFLEDVFKQGAVFDLHKSLTEKASGKTREAIWEKATALTEEQQQPERTAGTTLSEKHEDLDNHKYIANNGNGRHEAVSIAQDVLAKMEDFVDAFSREGIFLRAFKWALIEKSDEYPFLDPFTDQFDYREGKVSLDERIDMGEFAIGIAESFNLTISHLKKEFPKNMILPPSLKTELETALKKYQDIVKGLGIQSVPPLYFK